MIMSVHDLIINVCKYPSSILSMATRPFTYIRCQTMKDPDHLFMKTVNICQKENYSHYQTGSLILEIFIFNEI